MAVTRKTVAEIARMQAEGTLPADREDAPVYELPADDPLWTAPVMGLSEMQAAFEAESARRRAESNKVSISLRVDPDVLAWFRAQGPGYQGRMNLALRAAMERETRR